MVGPITTAVQAEKSTATPVEVLLLVTGKSFSFKS
jgi:hypothetical protein